MTGEWLPVTGACQALGITERIFTQDRETCVSKTITQIQGMKGGDIPEAIFPSSQVYQKRMFWKSMLMLFVVFYSLFAIAESTNAKFSGTARYAKGRIIMSNGIVVEGQELILNPNSVSMKIGGILNTYQLSEVQQVMVKRGRGHALKWGAGCGGGCAVINVLIYIGERGNASDEAIYQFSIEDFIGVTALWTGIFFGVGYLIGYVTDDWTPVYFAPRKVYSPGTWDLVTMSGRLLNDGFTLRYSLRF